MRRLKTSVITNGLHIPFIVAFAACSDPSTATRVGGLPSAFQAIVSNPVGTPGTPFNETTSAAGAGSIVYLSLPPHTIPDGIEVTISNRRAQSSLSRPLVDGGFDPVAVAAFVGDTLDMVVTTSSGTRSSAVIVPPKTRPRVVRTIPPRHKVDVPINARISVVFSEPIAPAAVTGTEVKLMRGTAVVPGTVTFAGAAQLVVEIQPSATLEFSTTYAIVVEPTVQDLDGESLGERIVAGFETAPPPAVGVGGVRVQVSTTGEGRDASGYTVRLGDRAITVEADDVDQFSYVPEGQYSLRVEDVAPNCTVGDYPRQIVVKANWATLVNFGVNCLPTHGVRVRATTTGTDLDPNGFQITLREAAVDSGQTLNVSSNGATTVYGLESSDVTLTLTGFAGNCSVLGANPRSVEVRPDGIGETNFDVMCSSAGLIAYADSSADGNVDIWGVRPSGAGRTRLTTDPGRDDEPAWSPDGSRIAFRSNRSGNDEIHVMNADGEGTLRLTQSPGADYDPAWSPDGNRIVFVSERDGNAEIYVMNADGGDLLRLTRNVARDQHPGWSPDGQRIVFESDRTGNGDIYVMNADGTGIVPLTTDASEDSDPVWSPDGRSILYVRSGTCDQGPEEAIAKCHRAVLVDANGTNKQLLSLRPPVVSEGWVIGEADVGKASWSPDGKRIAFTVVFCSSEGAGHCHLASAIWIVDLTFLSSAFVVDGSFSDHRDPRAMFPGRPSWRP